MMLETLKQLDEVFSLKKLYEQGIISEKVSMDYKIVIRVKMDMDINGSKRSIAVQHTADELHISIDRVWNALRRVF